MGMPEMALSQGAEFSPYSRFGLGNLSSGSMANHLGMGSLSLAVADAYTINPSNPASYAHLVKPTFQMGLRFQSLLLSNEKTTNNLSFAGLDNFSMAFPVANNWALAMGILPYSRVGYDLVSTQATEAGMVNFRYDGQGGMNKAFIGSGKTFNIKSYKVFKDSLGIPTDSVERIHQSLSLGFNFGYLFGNIEKNRRAIFDDPSFFNTRFTSTLQVSNPSVEIGIQYFKTLLEQRLPGKRSRRINLRLAVKWTPEISASLSSTELGLNYKLIGGVERVIDTSYFAESLNGRIRIPEFLGGGGILEFMSGGGRGLYLGFDLRLQDWTAFQITRGSEIIRDPNLSSQTAYSAGVEYCPKIIPDAQTGFFSKMRYRMGVRTGDTYLLIDGEQLSETAISGGFTLPLDVSRSASRLHFGMEFGSRGNTEAGRIKEDFLNFQLTFVLNPYFRSNWFIQTKYD
jgi:hypothetical protein